MSGGWSGGGGAAAAGGNPQTEAGGRLTLTSGTAVTTADVTGATTIYYTPYIHDRIGLYDGSAWDSLTFVETSLALGTLTSGLPYDVFGYDNAGTFALELLAWTNGTTRATALVKQSGVWCKTGALTRRYLGSFYTTSTTATEDSMTKRLVFNADNRVNKPVRVTDDTNSWSYTTTDWRQANASTANQIAVMVGLAEVTCDLMTVGNAAATAANNPAVGIQIDATTTLHASCHNFIPTIPASGYLCGMASKLVDMTPLGYHFYAWIERGATGGIFYGDNGGANIHHGLSGTISGV